LPTKQEITRILLNLFSRKHSHTFIS